MEHIDGIRVSRIESFDDDIFFAFFGKFQGLGKIRKTPCHDILLMRDGDEVSLDGAFENGVFHVSVLENVTVKNMFGSGKGNLKTQTISKEVLSALDLMKRLDWIKIFNREESDVEARIDGVPLLVHALRIGRLDLAEWLLAEGAKISVSDMLGKGVLEALLRMECHQLLPASSCEDIRQRLFSTLIEREPIFVDGRDLEGMNPFESAFMNSSQSISLMSENFGKMFREAWKVSLDVSAWASKKSLPRVNKFAKSWVRELLTILSIVDGMDMLEMLGGNPSMLPKGGEMPFAAAWLAKDWSAVDRDVDPFEWKNADGSLTISKGQLHLSLIKRMISDRRFLYGKHPSGEWLFANSLPSSPESMTFVNDLLSVQHEKSVPFLDWKIRISQFVEKERVSIAVENGCCATAASSERLSSRWNDEDLRKNLKKRGDEWLHEASQI